MCDSLATPPPLGLEVDAGHIAFARGQGHRAKDSVLDRDIADTPALFATNADVLGGKRAAAEDHVFAGRVKLPPGQVDAGLDSNGVVPHCYIAVLHKHV